MAKGYGGVRNSGGVRERSIRKAQKCIADVLHDLKSTGFSKSPPFCIGKVSTSVKRFAEDNGIELASSDIYISVKQITHTFRETKQNKISAQDLIQFPKIKNKMRIYYDGEAFVYTDLKNKFVLVPNYRLKVSRNKIRVVNYVTASRVTDVSEFNNRGRYVRVK